MGDLLAEIRFGDFLHLSKDHSRNLLRSESLVLAIDLDLDNGLAILVNDLVGEVLDIGLDVLLCELATDQTPGEYVSTLVPYAMLQKIVSYFTS